MDASSRHVSKVRPQSSAAMKDSREHLDKNREHLRHAPGHTKRAYDARPRVCASSLYRGRDDVGNAANGENNDNYSLLRIVSRDDPGLTKGTAESDLNGA